MAKRPDLVITNGEMSGRRFAVGTGALRLGRSSSNDIPIHDEELSRNHCLFEPSGETDIRVTDLASANGTVVNGEPIGADPVELKEGDLVEVGQTVIRVGDAAAAVPATTVPGVVDLGLGSPSPTAGAASAKRRSPLANILWVVAVLIACGAIALILLTPAEQAPAAKAIVAEETPVVRELVYEKVRADSNGIYRYALTLSADGTLAVKIDDTLNDRRMPVKQKPLTEEGRTELNEMLSWKKVKELDRDYVGVEPDPPAVDSQKLKVVYSTDVREVSVVNADEPEAFAAIREKLESFSKSELGVWAISYPRERLIELAEESVRLGDAKWEERDVNHGNLAEAIVAYREAIFYLETVNPKPECAATAAEGLNRAKTELDRRYVDQRFLADRALNLSQWETACEELKVLIQMVPDRKDDRNRDARQKLVSAETNMRKKGGKGK